MIQRVMKFVRASVDDSIGGAGLNGTSRLAARAATKITGKTIASAVARTRCRLRSARVMVEGRLFPPSASLRASLSPQRGEGRGEGWKQADALRKTQSLEQHHLSDR